MIPAYPTSLRKAGIAAYAASAGNPAGWFPDQTMFQDNKKKGTRNMDLRFRSRIRKALKNFVLLLMLQASLVQSSFTQEIYPKREMRAVWVATVRNIDWPSEPGLSVKQQKQEFVDLLDLHRENRMNAIVFHLRPACDAMYDSPFEPWAKWLSGTQGEAPDPYYDPLEFAIEECHKRNMELHAWFNPYRAVTGYKNFEVDSMHVSIQHPGWVFAYGENKYLDPGLPQVRDYVSNIIADVLRRYDIDAVHMDDYFYPYRVPNEKLPDDSTFYNHSRGFEQLEIDDWRRDNVDLIIRQIHDTIQSIKPWIPFAISPFGVWRNNNKDPRGSATRAKQTNYDDLYADILKWLQEGWIDQVIPQAYRHIGFEIADHNIIAEWWNSNAYGKDLFIGNGVYRMTREPVDKPWRTTKEIIRQLKSDRLLNNVSGNFYFSSRSFQENPAKLNQAMRKKIYPYPALIPVNDLVDSPTPKPPGSLISRRDAGKIFLVFDDRKNSEDQSAYYVVYRFTNPEEINWDDPANIYAITNDARIILNESDHRRKRSYYFAVTSVNRFHKESKPTEVIEVNY